MAQKEVTIYTTPTCPYCHLAKEFFKEKKIKYKEIDVSKNQEAAHKMIHKSGQMGVPQILIGGKIIVGFDRETIRKELKV